MTQQKIYALNLIEAGKHMFNLLLGEVNRLEEPLNMLKYSVNDDQYDRRIEILEVAIEVTAEMIAAKLALGEPTARFTRLLVDFQRIKNSLLKTKFYDNSAKN